MASTVGIEKESTSMETSSISDIVTLAETQPDEAEHSWQNDEMEEVESRTSEDTTVNDILDLHVDPSMMLSSVNTLLETLESTLSSLALFRDQSDEKDPIRDSIQSTSDECKKLHTQLAELESVVSVYAGSHEPGQSNSDSHIDPSLYKWTTECMIFLLDLNAYTERLRGVNDHDPDSEDWEDAFIDKDEASEELSFEDYQMKLVVLNSDLAGFIPILKVDCDEQRTSRIRFPLAIAESSAEYSWRNRRQGGLDAGFGLRPGSEEEWHRREMYALKDSLTECRDRLSKILPQASEIRRPWIESIQAGQSAAILALTEMLTNHPSEWLEAQLAGKLSYEEFMQLNMTHIQGFRRRFEKFVRDVDVQQASVRAGKFMENDVEDLQKMGLKEIDLDRLDDAVEKLFTMLRAGRYSKEETAEHPAARQAAKSDPFSNGC